MRTRTMAAAAGAVLLISTQAFAQQHPGMRHAHPAQHDQMHGMGMQGCMGMMGMMGSRDTAAAPRPAPAAAPAAAGCPPVDRQLVEDGRAVFAGPGNCQSCHGANAKGTGLAPDLTDTQWLNIDGSYGAIAQLVRSGVPQPKQHAAPMPAMGGARLAPEQVCAVAAYVFSLGHVAR